MTRELIELAVAAMVGAAVGAAVIWLGLVWFMGGGFRRL